MSLQVFEYQGNEVVGGSTGTATAIADDTFAYAFINSNGDQDYFSMSVVSGHTYTWATNGIGTAAINDTEFELLDGSGNVITSDDNSGPVNGSLLTWTANYTGTAYLRVHEHGNDATGGYSVSMNEGTTPFIGTISLDQAAYYLQYSYWQAATIGGLPHQFNHSNISVNITGLSSARQAVAVDAFSYWAEVANLTFSYTSGAADITVDDNNAGANTSSTYQLNGDIVSSSINIEAAWYGGSSAHESYTTQTFIHEIGHALGLGHAGAYNNSATYGVDNVYANDTWQWSVMSYMTQNNYVAGNSIGFAYTPMMADIVAVQSMYGANTTVHSGDSIYGHNATLANYDFANYGSVYAAPCYTIVDASGFDQLDASNYSYDQVIDLRPEHFSDIGGMVGNIGIARGVYIEKGWGGSGNDTFWGDGNAQWFNGGGGNDTYHGGGGLDRMDYTTTAYAMTLDLSNSGSQSISTDLGSDTIDLGGSTWIFYVGNHGSTVTGGSGYDIVASGRGNDSFNGGAGDNLFSWYIATGAVTVDINAGTASGDGSDTFSNVRDVDGSNGYDDILLGDSNANAMHGYGGDDWLAGRGGNDTLYGDGGTYNTAAYYNDNWADLTVTSLGGGVYTVASSHGDGTDTLVNIQRIYAADGYHML